MPFPLKRLGHVENAQKKGSGNVVGKKRGEKLWYKYLAGRDSLHVSAHKVKRYYSCLIR